MDAIRPPRLRHGDVVGIVSPSWGGAGAFPHRVRAGVKHLESLGFRVRLGRHAMNRRGFVSDTAENRVSDLHEMFEDTEIRAIIAATGGDHSCHLLPLLDFGLIRNNPKIFMGYSDITVLNVSIWTKTRTVTFNGPALITDFAERPSMFDYSESSFLRTLGRAEPPGAIQPSDWWTEEFLDWGAKKDLDRPRARQASEGPVWLRPGYAEGTLVGGCIESLQHLRGTEFWPDFAGAILFLETSEEKPSPARVDGMLMTSLVGGVGPDLISIDANENGQFFKSGHMLPFNDWLKAENVDMSKWASDPLLENGYKGKIYGLSLFTMHDAYVVINKELADKDGLLADAPLWGRDNFDTWDWDDFAEWLKAGTKMNSNGTFEQYGYGSTSNGLFLIEPRMAQLGGTKYDDDWSYEETESMSNSPAWVEAVQSVVDLNLKHQVNPSPDAQKAIQGGSFLAQKAVCASTWSTPAIWPVPNPPPKEM